MSGRRVVAIALAAAAGSGAALAIGACGSSSDEGPTPEQVASIKREVLREERAKQRAKEAERTLRELRREVERLKKGRGQGAKAGASAGGGGESGGSAGGSASCGGGVSVNAVTSCPFAANVAAAFYADGPGTVYATSPVTGKTYAMQCSGGVPTVCTGGSGAAVYIR